MPLHTNLAVTFVQNVNNFQIFGAAISMIHFFGPIMRHVDRLIGLYICQSALSSMWYRTMSILCGNKSAGKCAHKMVR